jgi:hypothetical protein
MQLSWRREGATLYEYCDVKAALEHEDRDRKDLKESPKQRTVPCSLSTGKRADVKR